MRKIVYFTSWLIALACVGVPAQSYYQSRDSNYNKSIGVAAYSGPGNVVTGAIAWWGLRGYNAAFSGNVANICDAATGLVCANATWAGSTLTVPTISGLTCGVGISCVVKTLYDQTGNGFDITNTTLSQMPAFTASVVGSLPGMTMSSVASTKLQAIAALIAVQPYTVSEVAKRTANFTTQGEIISASSGSCAFTAFNSATNQVIIYNSGSNFFSATAADSSFHALQFTFNTGSSIINVNGSATNGTTDSCDFGTAPVLGNNNVNTFDGVFLEGGVWASAFNGTQSSNMSSNQHSYYGF